MTKRAAVVSEDFTVGANVTITDGEYKDRKGTIQRLGSAGDIMYLHIQVDNVNTIITYRTFQVQKGS